MTSFLDRIKQVESTFMTKQTISVTCHAQHMMTVAAENVKIPVVPGALFTLQFLTPVAGAPKLSDWLRTLADAVERHESTQCSKTILGDRCVRPEGHLGGCFTQ